MTEEIKTDIINIISDLLGNSFNVVWRLDNQDATIKCICFITDVDSKQYLNKDNSKFSFFVKGNLNVAIGGNCGDGLCVLGNLVAPRVVGGYGEFILLPTTLEVGLFAQREFEYRSNFIANIKENIYNINNIHFED